MKLFLQVVLLVAIVQWSTCSESEGKQSCGVGYELIQVRLDEMQLKLTEILGRFNVMHNNQALTIKRLKELTASLESGNTRQPSPNVTIPTGCVKIRSFFGDKYLAVSSNYDSQRRQLGLQNNPEEWTLTRHVGNYYRITRRQGQEDLYAAMDDLARDSQRRRIFTWIPGFGEDQGKWEIEEAAGFPGTVHIRSGYFGEYLYAADFDNLVFTWIPKGTPGKDTQYLWQIEQC
uniref:Putative conserved secreted protein n=2 Tax=Culex tarsalis TaxID=7177 RepID=A0A1Q3FPC6_CULTA